MKPKFFTILKLTHYTLKAIAIGQNVPPIILFLIQRTKLWLMMDVQ